MTTTMNNHVINPVFTFRSKFEKILNDVNRPFITAAFKKFCNLTPDTARNILWHLTYNMDIAYATLDELGLNQEIIPSEKISCLRNELRFQYEKLFPRFLEVDIPAAYQEAFSALVNHTDAIVANVVFEHCESIQFVEDSLMIRILSLLNSDKENNYFGGIRSLFFSRKEAAYLKLHHTQIYNLLKVMFDHYQEQRGTLITNRPFEGLANLIEDAGMDLPFEYGDTSEKKVPAETQDEKPVKANPGFKNLSSEEVLEYKDVFASFVKNGDMNALLEIGNLGFDLNMVMTKKEAIRNLLDAEMVHTETHVNLLNAMAANEEAVENVRKAAEALMN